MLKVCCTKKNGCDQLEEDLVIKVTVEDVFVILFACFVRQAQRVHKGCQSNQLENSRKFSRTPRRARP